MKRGRGSRHSSHKLAMSSPLSSAAAADHVPMHPQHQQHDLQPAIARHLIADLDLSPSTVVFEVGPGTGALTIPLLAAGAQVVAVELDPQRAGQLAQRCAAEIAGDRLRLACADARGWQPEVCGHWRVVANPPFQHSAVLLRQWLLEPPAAGQPQAIDLVLQLQTAQKLVGESGHWSQSSILWQVSGRPQVRRRLRRVDVTPPARVDLAWWSWVRADDAPDGPRLRRLDTLLQRAFRGEHSVRQALRGLATGPILSHQSRLHGWDPDAASRTVPPLAWLALADFLGSVGKLP